MALNIGDNFNYQGKKPLDSRMLFDTIALMKAYSENYLPDITLAFNKEDGKMYVFNRTNDVDETTGKWREFEGGAGVTDYDDLLNKPLEKQAVTETKYMFQRMSDMLYEVYSLELETGATLYKTETGNPTTWTLYVDGDTYKIDSASGGVLTYLGEQTEVIGTQVVVNDPYKDAFRVENLTNVKINNVKDGDVFTFRDEGQSLYAWQPLEGEPFYSEKEIPEEGDVVYDSTGGVISQMPIDMFRWTTDHQAQEGFAFIRQASNPTPYYDIQVGRYPQGDIIKEKYWTNTEASGGNIQVSELPAATAENVGKVYQYIGADTQDYKHDFFYENKYTEGTNGYYAFLIENGVEAYYATSETPSDGDPIYSIYEGEIQQIPLQIGYWVVDAESPSGYSLYAVEGGGQTMPTTRDSTQDISGEPGGYQRVSVEVQEGNYDTLKNKPVYVGDLTQQGYGWTAEYEYQGQTETYDFLTLVDELPENGNISAYDIENDEWFELDMQDGLAYGEDTVTRNSSIDQDVTVTTKEVNEKYYDIIGIAKLPNPSGEYEGKVYRYVGDDAFRQNPSGAYIYFNKHDLVICQEINYSYYWTKYGMIPEPTSLPTDWEGGYGQTNNYYNDGAKTIVSYDGVLYTGTVNWSTFQWTWEELQMGVDDYNDLANKLSAGIGIKIYDEYSDFSAIQGPCENGFHIPQSSEWTALQNVITTPTQLEEYLHLPYAGEIGRQGTVSFHGTNHYYWNASVGEDRYAQHLFSYKMSDEYYPTNQSRRYDGMPIRAFKDVPVIPDNTWTETLTGKIWEKDGLISILVDTDTYVTMKDKNEGATVVFNVGDTLSAANCGNYFQRGNNFGFSFDGETVVSTTVDTTGYSRENPYSSNEFHVGNDDWSTQKNNELWGATTGVRELTNTVVNTGVLSVNGKEGEVTLNIPQSLPELLDVNITKIKDKQIIHYDTATKKYVNVAPTEYEAGTGIIFTDREVLNDCSAMQGPCPEGWHIPSKAEADAVVNAIPYSTAEEKEIAKSALHFPPAGYCRLGIAWESRGSLSRVWQSSISDDDDAYHLSVENSINSSGVQNPTNAMPIRPFKDNPVVPDSTWTETITGVAWYKASEGLISIKTGTNSYLTLMDKNLGATTVWNYGDSPTDANCGKYFQWGNNYPFDWGKQYDSQSAQNVTGYGPSEYSSNIFVSGYTWMTPYTPNLRGMQTGVQPLYQPGSVINNTSMNESDVAFATVTLNGITAILSNAFVTTETFVDYLVKTGTPVGTITITVANGTVTITSTATEALTLLLRLEKVNSNSVILN